MGDVVSLQFTRQGDDFLANLFMNCNQVISLKVNSVVKCCCFVIPQMEQPKNESRSSKTETWSSNTV